jgi:hypothetical protein
VKSETDPIDSSFNQQHLPCTFYSTGKHEIPVSVSAGREITYGITEDFAHVLRGTELVGRLPHVQVKEEWRGKCLIAWSPNPGIHIVSSAVMTYGTLFSFTQDPIFLDCEHQFNLEPGVGKTRAYEESIGNIPELTSFQEELRPHTIHVKQRWFYSNFRRHWPLYKLKKNRTLHKYTYRPYTSIIRVKILNEEGEWVPQIASEGNLKYYTIEKDPPYPSLVGKFSFLTPSELAVRSAPDCKDEIVPVRDVVICKSTDRKKYGSVETLILRSKFPCYYFYAVALDLKSSEYGFYANYTSDTHNLGGHSITSMSMNVGDYPRFTDWGPSHFNVGQGDNFPSLPRCCGYNALSLADDPNNSDADSAPVFSGTDSTITTLKATVEGTGSEYHLLVLMVVSRPIIFSTSADKPEVRIIDSSDIDGLQIYED